MNGYRISEVAERTGFTPATLRYYEELGVVPAPARTEAGYRLYDERALGRLTFVARAKQLGLTLEEVAHLSQLWDGDQCAPVQHRMAAFVADKLGETRSRITELRALADQLETVAGRLGEEPQVGPCDDRCACTAEESTPVTMACTLPPDELLGRVSDWEAVVGRAVAREPLDGGVRLIFPAEDGLAAELAGLAQVEQTCCAFFDFAVGIGPGTITLDVRAPADGQPVVAALFGAAPR